MIELSSVKKCPKINKKLISNRNLLMDGQEEEEADWNLNPAL
jgi:hypothetical protein